MNKEQAKRVTLDQLIARKAQREKDKLKVKEIYIPCLDATMLFKKIHDNTVLDVMEEADGEGGRGAVDMYIKLIYLCCEDLQNPELHKEFDILDPYDIVTQLFGLKDIMSLGEELTEFLELSDPVKKVKN